MPPRRRVTLALLALAGLGGLAFAGLRRGGPGAQEIAAAYAKRPKPKAGPRAVFHLGHSLVGRDMPAMLAQLAGPGHRYASQLGWGASLRAHWEPSVEIAGFEAENEHPAYQDAKAALASGAFDALVLTEMIELRDAIRFHDSARYLRLWAERARAGNPDIEVFLYETWHRLDDPAGWLARLEGDLASLWEDQVLLKRADADFLATPIYVIPAGQVMAAFTRRLEAAGGIGAMRGREDLFARDETGARDPIHLSDLGTYLVALIHYAVIYQRNPLGLPSALKRADGTQADSPGQEAARVMQEVVWDVVTGYEKTGVRV